MSISLLSCCLYEIWAQLSAAMNPCPCGNLGHPQKVCRCAPVVVTRYQKRISGPLLDRIDIHIEVPSVDYEKLSSDRLAETSEAIRKRVQAARNVQSQRFVDVSDIIQSAMIPIRPFQDTDWRATWLILEPVFRAGDTFGR